MTEGLPKMLCNKLHDNNNMLNGIILAPIKQATPVTRAVWQETTTAWGQTSYAENHQKSPENKVVKYKIHMNNTYPGMQPMWRK